MLTPSYSELMRTINTDKKDSKITSRYTIVLAVAKRARQIIDGAEPLTYAPTDRAVSIAVREMSEGKIKINIEEDLLDGSYERMLANQNKYKSITTASTDDLREELKDNYDVIKYVAGDDDMGDDFEDELETADDAFLYEGGDTADEFDKYEE